MREIKFRVFNNKKMIYVPSDDFGFEILDYLYYNDPVMQYTGFKDKNGKEIYEGDIINGTPNFT